jgi:hypothetical protein
MKEILSETSKRIERSKAILAKSENTSLKLANKIRLIKEALKN